MNGQQTALIPNIINNVSDGTKFNKTYYTELLLTPGNNMPSFNPEQFLQNRQIFSIEVFTALDVPTSIGNLPTATADMLSGMFLTLYCSDVNLPLQKAGDSFNGQGFGHWIKNIPLLQLHRMNNQTDSYVRDLFQMYGEIIDLQQSSVYINAAAAALITTNTVIPFNFGTK